MKPKIYIAGKIAGQSDYKAKFEAAAQDYEKMGYAVLNPAKLPTGLLPADYMRICFAMIDTADVVAFLPDYESSLGAQLELQYCRYIEKTVKLPEIGEEGIAFRTVEEEISLRAIRKKAGLSQTALAKLLGVSQSAVSQWEIGKAAPGVGQISNLSCILSVPVDRLVTVLSLGGAVDKVNV